MESSDELFSKNPDSSKVKEEARELFLKLLLQQDKENDDHAGVILGSRLAKPKPIETDKSL